MVKGPGPLSVSTRPAAWTAATSVEKSSTEAATSTTVGPPVVPALEAAAATLAPVMLGGKITLSIT